MCGLDGPNDQRGGEAAAEVVPNADLPKLFEAGWTFKASLGDGHSIVEAPVGGWADLVKTDTMDQILGRVKDGTVQPKGNLLRSTDRLGAMWLLGERSLGRHVRLVQARICLLQTGRCANFMIRRSSLGEPNLNDWVLVRP